MAQQPLRPKQKLLLDNIIKGMTAKDAAAAAGYSPKSGGITASKLLRRADAQEYLDKLRVDVVDDTILSTRERLRMLSSIATDMSEHVKDRIKSIDILNKMTNEYTNRVEHSGSIGITLTDEELLDAVKEILED